MSEPKKDIPHITIQRERNTWNGWCVNYDGFYDRIKPKTHCRAGVEYAAVETQVEFTYSRADGHRYTARAAHPCFKHEFALTTGCAQCRFPTPEEIKAHDAECAVFCDGVERARAAIIKHIADKRGVVGSIDCPVCKTGTLGFSRASNGHVHARCSTAKCVAWME